MIHEADGLAPRPSTSSTLEQQQKQQQPGPEQQQAHANAPTTLLMRMRQRRGLVDATEPNTSFTPPVPPPARLGKPRCCHNDEARGLAAYYSAATEHTEAPRARSRSPRMATLQGMARQMATLQATERMRTLKWALASVDDSIAFCDDQELLEAFNQVEAGVHKMGYAIIKVAFFDNSAEPQQQQAEPAFLDSSAEPGQQQAEPAFFDNSVEPGA